MPRMPPDRTRRLAVLDCEDREKWLGHERLWIDPLRRDGDEWTSYRVWAGELPEPGAVDGVVVSGSHHSVLDDSLPWLEPLFVFLRAAVLAEDGPNVVGACFGCQALGRALGGQVARNPGGRFVFGAERIELAPGFAALAGADRGGASIALLESHGECVTELPAGAEPLARSASAPHEIFAIGWRALAVQGHPELTRQALVETILPSLREERRLDAGQEAAALQSMDCELDDRFMIGVIRRFLDGPRG
jgi:GMP synthase (glutamine-hydrolysing)